MIINLLFFSIFDFAIYVIGAFVFFSTAILFFDSWKVDRQKKSLLIRFTAFLLIALAFAVTASTQNGQPPHQAITIVKIVGLSLILVSYLKEPILKKPDVGTAPVKRMKNGNAKKDALSALFISPLFSSMQWVVSIVPAALSLMIFWRQHLHSTKGLDKQLKPLSFAFLFFSLSEIAYVPIVIWSNTTNVFWSKILALHGTLWNVHQLLLLVGLIILGVWTWGYIRFRIQIQIFTVILASVYTAFIFITLFFSYLLINNLEKDALSHLETDAKVFQYTLDQLELKSLSFTQSIASDIGLQQALVDNNEQSLYEITSSYLLSQNLSTLIIATPKGDVIVRTEDKESKGDNIASDPMVKTSLSGSPLASISVEENPIHPNISIKSTAPIYKNGVLLGVVVTGVTIDDAFVDGIKAVTGLDATVLARNVRVATTITAPDGKSRSIGTLQTDSRIIDTVLRKGDNFVGRSEILNNPYYTAYTPLRKYGGDIVGMLFIGKPQLKLLELTQQSINLTFFGSLILMVLSIPPVYFISRFIEENVSA